MSTIESAAADFQFVFVDLEGAPHRSSLSRAMVFSDFVVVPMQTSAVDVRQAARAIECHQRRGAHDAASWKPRPPAATPHPADREQGETPSKHRLISSSQRRLEAEIAGASAVQRFRSAAC